MAFKFLATVTSALLFTLSLGAPVLAQLSDTQENAVEELAESSEVFQELATDPEIGIPPILVQDSEAIIVISNLGRGGFIVGGWSGDGLMVARQPNGTWSNPAFVTLGGGSIGLQVGGRSSDIVMLVRNREALGDILEGNIDFDGVVSGTAGPETGSISDPREVDGDILVYSRSSGLFGGAVLDGGTLSFDNDRNEAFYNVVNVTPEEILLYSTLTPIVDTDILTQSLRQAQ
ncbi:MAG: lipid-binding SYLF domain-containing protein [Synechococcales bacterium]|nr:lipid-binding SYLF domain-containing protein [Synechococcales bacterium]